MPQARGTTRGTSSGREGTGVLRKALRVLTGMVAAAGLTLVGVSPAAAEPSPLPSFVQVSAGNTHTCAVTAAGAAYCWGSDEYGQLGNGPGVTANQSSPSPVITPPGVTWAQISASEPSTCAVTTAGALYCWGSFALGNEDVDHADEPYPVPTPTGVTWKNVAHGSNGACALTTTDALYCWGYSGLEYASLPTLVPGGPWATVSTGTNDTCAVDTSGTGYCWGAEFDGELGNGGSASDIVSDQPAQVAAPPGVQWAAITAREQLTCGVTTTGAAYCWGTNFDGALGDGFTTGGNSATPSLVATPIGTTGVTWTDVQPASNGACGLTTTGAIYCWGDEYYSYGNAEPSPLDTPAGVSVVAMTASAVTSCILSDAGRAWCRGADNYGQIGDGGRISTEGGNAQAIYFSPVGLPQTITFADLPSSVLLADGSFTVSATASSGLPVTFTDGAGYNACTVSGSTVTPTRTGYCSIRATVAGGDGWAPSEASTSVEVDVDSDGDGVGDRLDNCRTTANPGQVNTDNDSQGNACDADDDDDGVLDVNDAFPLDRTESVDTDGDGIGNNADTDDDGDGVRDTADAFPLNPNEQVDTDHDGTGNNADTDDDADGVPDSSDALPLEPT
jgi:alpha-tubulin suppressor-like RCC1 family protein